MKNVAAWVLVGFFSFQPSAGAGWLGIMVQDLTPRLAIQYGLLITEGVVVVRVQFNSPAMEGGIEEGDVILFLNEKKISDSSTLKEAVSNHPSGQDISLRVLRERREITLTITLGSGPMDAV